MTSWFIYLLNLVLCHAVFYLLYIGLFKRLAFFQVNRFVILFATVLSFIIPAISIPFWDPVDSDLIQSFSFALDRSTGSGMEHTKSRSNLDNSFACPISFTHPLLG